MKGLCWKGSLGLFNQSHSRLQLEGKKKVTKPPNKPEFHLFRWGMVLREPSSGCGLRGGSAGTICARQQDAISALSSSPGAQTAPNSAARCLRLAFQHMALRLLGRRIMSRTTESSRQSRGSVGSAGLFRSAGKGTDEDQARPPGGC